MMLAYLIVAIATFVLSLTVQKSAEGKVTVGDIIVFGLLSAVPGVNAIFLLLAVGSFLASVVDLNKKVF